MEISIFLLFFVPLITAVIIPLLDFIDKKIRTIILSFSGLLELFISLYLLIKNYSLLQNNQINLIYKTGWNAPFFKIYLSLDELGLLFSVLTSLALSLIIIYALTAREVKPEQEKQFFILLFLVLAMMQGTILSGDLLNIFIFFELMTVFTAPLIAITDEQISIDAAIKYLIYGLIGGIFFLLGLVFIWFELNTLNIGEIASNFGQINHTLQLVIVSFFLLGLFIKLGIFPFHIWLPLAHSKCPSSISALLSGVILKIYIYIFLRIFWSVIDFKLIEASGLNNIILYMGLFSSMIGHFFALQTDDIKKMLAFSSIGNIGMIIGVMALNTATALYGALLHVVGHLLMKTTLFTATGYLLKFTPGHLIQDFKGVAGKNNGIFICCIITMLSMIGLPPLIGFMSKWYILVAFLEKNNYVGITVVIIGSILSVIYYFRYVSSAYEQVKIKNNHSQKTSKLASFYQEKIVLTTIYIFTTLIIFSGVFYKFISIPLSAAIRVLISDTHYIKFFPGG